MIDNIDKIEEQSRQEYKIFEIVTIRRILLTWVK